MASSVAEDEDLDRRVPPGGPDRAALAGGELQRDARRASGARPPTATRALAATRRFAADAGHELRTPLTSVQATLSTLERHLDLPPERRAEMLGDALAEQRRLVELLDGLQALARGDAGPLEFTEVDLAEVVDAAAAAAVERHPGLDLSAELPDTPVAVEGWEPGLRLLADNLVENAVRHGRPHGHIRVTLDAPPDGEDGGGAVLTVDDDGPGIADADRERIFAPFARLEADQRRGLGPGPRAGRSSRSATTARGSTSASRRWAARASASASPGGSPPTDRHEPSRRVEVRDGHAGRRCGSTTRRSMPVGDERRPATQPSTLPVQRSCAKPHRVRATCQSSSVPRSRPARRRPLQSPFPWGA